MRAAVQDTIDAIENLLYLNISGLRLTREEGEALIMSLENAIHQVMICDNSDVESELEDGDHSEE